MLTFFVDGYPNRIGYRCSFPGQRTGRTTRNYLLAADLSTWSSPPIFDSVIVNMVFIDIPNYTSALCQLRCCPQEERPVKQTYGHFFHHPLSFYLNSVLQAGCTLQQVIEPQLEENIAQHYDAKRYGHVPGYILISAIKVS